MSHSHGPSFSDIPLRPTVHMLFKYSAERGLSLPFSLTISVSFSASLLSSDEARAAVSHPFYPRRWQAISASVYLAKQILPFCVLHLCVFAHKAIHKARTTEKQRIDTYTPAQKDNHRHIQTITQTIWSYALLYRYIHRNMEERARTGKGQSQAGDCAG